MMYRKPRIVELILLLVLSIASAHSQSAETTKKNEQDSVAFRELYRATVKVSQKNPFWGDSTGSDSTQMQPEPTMPGGSEGSFLPIQDSAFIQALRLGIPFQSRLALDTKAFLSQVFSMQKRSEEMTPLMAIQRNLQLPAEVFRPRGEEISNFQYNIVKTMGLDQYSLFPYMMFNSFQIPISAISSFFGVTQDVSPTIRYTVEKPNTVRIVIYSPQAKQVAVVFDKFVGAGGYSITWNGRADDGRKLPAGDYIAEVRIGDTRVQLKHIVL